ncbi:hypothetical protein N7456_010313 [Penicillium angulare]|uniref:Uncharacterized protein n=1 Tax=Penicillium angulare TaxID=116970 RepID=A0A9W9F6G9_9EURO|nr:hypothetical protein N7456_010313 [Penicillium angulare]
MALPMFIPPCVCTPTGQYHFPSPDLPLRIQIEGPLTAIEKLLPHVEWKLPDFNDLFPQPAGPELAKLTYKAIYGRDASPDIPGDLLVQNEHLGWVLDKRPERVINYYGVTFDHLVPADDTDPEVLQINISEVEDDIGVFANKYLLFSVDPDEFIGKKVLATPRCCQVRKGTTDRKRVNGLTNVRQRGWKMDDVFPAKKKTESNLNSA